MHGNGMCSMHGNGQRGLTSHEVLRGRHLSTASPFRLSETFFFLGSCQMDFCLLFTEWRGGESKTHLLRSSMVPSNHVTSRCSFICPCMHHSPGVESLSSFNHAAGRR